ncbi:thioredoxin family protein [Sphingobacterium hungaricum]
MKNLILIGLLLLVTKASLAQSSKEIQWISFEQLSDSLSVNPKKVFLYFHTDWCSYCKKMDRESFQNEEVIQKLNKDYYAVKLDAETTDTIYFEQIPYTNKSIVKRSNQYHALAEAFIPKGQEAAFPLSLILSENFTITQRQTKYLSIKDLLRNL